MAYMFQQMRQTVQPSGLFGDDGMARSTYEYLLDQAVSAKAAIGPAKAGASARSWRRNGTPRRSNEEQGLTCHEALPIPVLKR